MTATAAGRAGGGIGKEEHNASQGDDVVLPEGVSSDWWDQAQKDIHQAEYNVTWQEQTYLPDVAAAYQAPNRAHNLRTYFTPAGIRIIPRARRSPQWELGLTLTGFGYAGSTQPVANPDLMTNGHRIDYQRGNVSERYINTEDGLEQGFTILEAPPPQTKHGQAGEPSSWEMALSGGLVPSLAERRSGHRVL